jgi:hypothetical protein
MCARGAVPHYPPHADTVRPFGSKLTVSDIAAKQVRVERQVRHWAYSLGGSASSMLHADVSDCRVPVWYLDFECQPHIVSYNAVSRSVVHVLACSIATL